MQVIQAVLLVSAVFGSIGAAVPNPNERIPGSTLSNPVSKKIKRRELLYRPSQGTRLIYRE